MKTPRELKPQVDPAAAAPRGALGSRGELTQTNLPNIEEAALWALAERLYYFLEKYDPSANASEWDGLSEWERDYYLTCVIALLADRQLVLAALNSDVSALR